MRYDFFHDFNPIPSFLICREGFSSWEAQNIEPANTAPRDKLIPKPKARFSSVSAWLTANRGDVGNTDADRLKAIQDTVPGAAPVKHD